MQVQVAVVQQVQTVEQVQLQVAVVEAQLEITQVQQVAPVRQAEYSFLLLKEYTTQMQHLMEYSHYDSSSHFKK
jgi:hypothetical protein